MACLRTEQTEHDVCMSSERNCEEKPVFSDIRKPTDGTSKTEMFFVDLQSDFLKLLMEHVSLMGF